MRVGPEIKRGAGRKWEGDLATQKRGFDFLDLFGSFWGNAKKNKTFEVKLKLDNKGLLWLVLLFQQS